MIVRGSRYENAAPVKVKTTDGSYRYAVYTQRSLMTEQVAFVYRTTMAGDRLDNLADVYYGKSTLWWVIAKANPEIMYPDDIPPGTVLRIPSAGTLR
jgi:nucleoid-associated protein YgaU